MLPAPPPIAAAFDRSECDAAHSRRGGVEERPCGHHSVSNLRSMKFSPTFLGCVLSSLAENLRFAATVETLSLTRSRPKRA